MKRIKLLGLLSLFVVPVPGSASFSTSYRNENNIIASETKNYSKDKINDPEPEPEHFFRVGDSEYDTFEAAINGATDGDTIQVLKDYEIEHSRETIDNLPQVSITKSLTINGIGDDNLQHEIKGQAILIDEESTVDFNNVTINGDKSYNQSGTSKYATPLIDCQNGSTINLNGNTIVKNYKFYSPSVIRLGKESILNIYDNVEITDCAAKFGIIRLDSVPGNCPAVYMYGGEIHDNSSSSVSNQDGAAEGVIAFVSGGDEQTTGTPGKFYIYGGEIHDNTAVCWSNPAVCRSVGLIFLHYWYVDVKILGGSIYNNISKYGGAVCYGASGAQGDIEIGGDAKVYGNYGYNSATSLFDSNIYIDNPSIQKVKVSQDYPLTQDAIAGVFLSNNALPTEGNSKTVIYEAEHKDLSHFVADNEDYTMRYEGDDNHTIAIYKYTEDDPHFSEPIFNNDLHYNGKEQQLILTPGEVTTAGGIMKYSQDYQEGMEIDDAHWTDNPNEIVGKDLGDYKVSYYVTASTPFKASEVITQTIHIKSLMNINWPEDKFIANGSVQEIKPTYINAKGETVELEVKITVNGEETEFKGATAGPDTPYVVTVIDPKDPNFDFPEECSKQYIMRIDQEEYEEEHMEIETIPGSDKPYVKVESDIGFDAWTKLHAKSVDKSDPEEKEEYEQATSSLNENKNLKSDDNVSAVYDVKMLNQDNIEVQPDGSLKVYFALPKGISVNNNISIYHIHVNEDGSKEIAEIKHDYTDDGYASIVTDKLSAFVIVHHQKSLLWLIITLSVISGLLVGGIVFTLVKVKKVKQEDTNQEVK